jgi:hypothetical protein
MKDSVRGGGGGGGGGGGEGFIISITCLLFHFQEQELSGCSWYWEFVSTFVFRKSNLRH